MCEWTEPRYEPSLAEMLDDPIIRALMRRDRVRKSRYSRIIVAHSDKRTRILTGRSLKSASTERYRIGLHALRAGLHSSAREPVPDFGKAAVMLFEQGEQRRIEMLGRP